MDGMCGISKEEAKCLSLYPVKYGRECSVLQKLLKSLVHLEVHTDTQQLPYHAHAWYILQVWHFKRPHHMMAFCWTLSKHPPCSWEQRHVNQAIPHKDIWIPSTFNYLLMSTTALFNCNYIGTCIQNPHKRNWVWLHTFLAFVEIVGVPSSHAHILHVLIPWHSTWPHYMMAWCRTLSKHPPCSRKDISTKLFPTKTSDQLLSMRCSWRHLPSSSATTLAHALATPPPQKKKEL
jgi:hypothetical protein